MRENRILSLLEQGDWGQDAPMIQGLKNWEHYPYLLDTYRTLDEEALYKSRVHGSGHIHRVLLFAALISWKEELATDLLEQYFYACCYHDVGRTFDGFDLYHGARSSLRLEELTGLAGQRLVELKAAVTAHAHPDADMVSILKSFQPEDYPRTEELTCLLKDADNLDRVRLKDLNAKFMRHESARELVPFAWRLLDLDQAWKHREQ